MGKNTSQMTKKLVLTALMASLILMATIFLKIPIPLSTGYVHLGDGMIFLAVLLLGGRYGAAAAGIGSALADLFSGYAVWAPFTLVIKGGMALLMGVTLATALKLHARKHKKDPTAPTMLLYLVSMAVAVVWMILGYYLAEGLLYGNWVAPLLSMIWNVGQGVVGIVIAVLIAVPLGKTPARHAFTYPMSGKLEPSNR